MNEAPPIVPTPEANRAAKRLSQQVEWSEDFWLGYVFTIDANQAEFLRRWIADRLSARGATLHIVRPTSPVGLRLQTILEQPDAGCTWVEAIREPQDGLWTDAWIQLILRTNERRELLRERLQGGLVLVMHPALKPDVRTAGPDLWSIRSVVFELPPGNQASLVPTLPPPPPPLPSRFADAELLDIDLARWSETVDAMPASQRAQSLFELAERMRNAGQYQQAAKYSEKALSAAREWVQIQPEADGSILARALEALALDLAILGAEQGSIKLLEEAVGLRRTNAKLLVDGDLALANTLHRLGALASTLGDHGRAEATLREAASLLRRRPGSQHGVHVVQSLLASTLNRLGTVLLARGRPVEALQATEDARVLVRPLAASDPESFTPILVGVLNNLSSCLAMLGRREEALETISEAVALSRVHARAGTHRDGLASSLYNYGLLLCQLGRPTDAVEATSEAVSILGQLIANGERSLLPQLAMTLIGHAGCLRELGQPESALSATREALAIYRDLAADRPGAYRHELAIALHNLARQLVLRESWREMLEAAKEAVELRRELARSGEQIERQLAQSLALLATASEQLGEVEHAAEALDEALRELRPNATPDDPLVTVLTNALVNCRTNHGLERPSDS